MESTAGAKGKSRMCQFACKSVHNNRSRWPGCHNMRQRSSKGLKRGGGGEEERRILIKPGNDCEEPLEAVLKACVQMKISNDQWQHVPRGFKTSDHIVMHPYNYHHMGKLRSSFGHGSVAGFSFSVSLFDVLHHRWIPKTYKNTRRERGIDPRPRRPCVKGCVPTYLLLNPVSRIFFTTFWTSFSKKAQLILLQI